MIAREFPRMFRPLRASAASMRPIHNYWHIYAYDSLNWIAEELRHRVDPWHQVYGRIFVLYFNRHAHVSSLSYWACGGGSRDVRLPLWQAAFRVGYRHLLLRRLR